jgi:SAM-dependent MidA family methyltransferase
VLTLDYGYCSPEYFHPLRKTGTLTAYLGHRASPDYGRLPGGQDLTSHVNFTALIRAGEKAGLQYTGLIPQDRFLVRLGLLGEMEAVEKKKDSFSAAGYWREKLALRSLTAPQPSHGGFQALIQHKGIAAPVLRCFH